MCDGQLLWPNWTEEKAKHTVSENLAKDLGDIHGNVKKGNKMKMFN